MTRNAGSVDGAGVVVRRLRARQGEIEDAIFAGVRVAVPEAAAGDVDSEYVNGLRTAVAAAVEFGLAGIERGEERAGEIPAEAVAQARLAARSGVSLEAVLRRYIVGHALLWDYVMEEADRVQRAGQASGLREMSRAQAALLDQLVIGVTREHVAELQRAGRSREHRLLERVRMLLAGERQDVGGVAPGGVDAELGYDIGGWHLGVIARGRECEPALRGVAQVLDRRLLCVAPGEGVAWAWLGGQHALSVAELERAVCEGERNGGGFLRGEQDRGVALAVGEPAQGLEGWRVTHRQAQDAMAVAARRPRALTRYADVALLASALKDETLARTLIEVYVAPLVDTRGGDEVLLRSLRAYLAAERSVSSTAAALGVARRTVESRLRAIEERLGRALHPCPAELEVALLLDELGSAHPSPEISIVDGIIP
jgi:PucR C-terminal helix-turn-helix domain/GGDEF-like domain